MKLSTRSRYGVRIMFELTRNYGNGPLLLKEIGKRQGISQKYLSNLIIPLKGAGLVKSFRGARGGYSLARLPEEITLLEIVRIMEGDIDIVDSVKQTADPFMEIWAGLNKVVREYLQGITLEDITKAQRAEMYYI